MTRSFLKLSSTESGRCADEGLSSIPPSKKHSTPASRAPPRNAEPLGNFGQNLHAYEKHPCFT